MGLFLNWTFSSSGAALEPSEPLRSEALPYLQSVTLFVDSGRGSDITGNGSDRAPFKTITYAAKVAQPYSVIQLAAGIYSTQTGENFPIQLKPNVSLQQGQASVIQGQIYQSGKVSHSVSANRPAPPLQQARGQLPEAPGYQNPVVNAGATEDTNLPADFSDLPDLTPGASPEGPTLQPPSATVPQSQSPIGMPSAAPPGLVKPPQVSRGTEGQNWLASTVSAASGTQRPSSPSRATLLGFRYRVVVETVDEAARSRLRFLVPDAFRSSYQGKTVMQVGAYRQQVEVDEMIQRLSSNGFAPVVEQLADTSVNPVTQPQSVGRVSNPRVNTPLVPVPGAPIPIGNAGNLPLVIVPRSAPQKLDGPPPPPSRVALLGFRYRVVVETVDEAARSRLRFLVPDAFRSSYQGKTVMQVGAYRQQVEVDEMIQRLSSNGFAPVVEQLQ